MRTLQLPQIRLQSISAQIELKANQPQQRMEQPKAELSIQQPQADVNIETIKGKLTIDQTQAWEDMDLKHISKRIEEAANLGYQDWLDGIARRAQQGDELMKIELGGNPIAKQAKENSQDPMYDFNIGYIPSHFSVKTNYEPAQVKIDVQVNKPVIEAKRNKPILDYTPGDVQVNLARYNDLQIDFVNLKHIGPNFELEI
ncbi:DUF6470 family protein [Cytobacillus sp. IB215665]|uniref:DUF6470 family protein n=1 Tax=Cytobacillus sp. IB215665 TaxID=3097357 RepID=UPI002A14CC32|nr:DUF6470 family protein [Cytobacillus sp. IB215665]MDX8363822.1 DUF6470 family protein [Cytobacillus sp. IB215665]